MPKEVSSSKLSYHPTWSYKLHSNVQVFHSASLSFSKMVVEVDGETDGREKATAWTVPVS